MKTTKSILVVLFALLTAQIASAYYCPSTGRWLSRDPMNELGFENLQAASMPSRIGNSVSQSSGRWMERDKTVDASASSVIAKNLRSGPSRFFGAATDNQPLFQPTAKQSTDFIDYQFCHNDPMDRYDIDGRMDVPAPVCQFYILQGVVGVVIAGADWYMWQKECNYLADHPETESYGRTPGSAALTIANLAIIAYHCPQGGRVYMHVWFDDKCNCKRNYVIICNSCVSGPGA